MLFEKMGMFLEKQEDPWTLGRPSENDCFKGLGEYSSSQSPAVNFDRSAVSLRLNKAYVDKITGCRTSTNKSSDICDRAIFGCQGHNLNKLDRGSQDGATNIISKL